jgi:hypothetical protein
VQLFIIAPGEADPCEGIVAAAADTALPCSLAQAFGCLAPGSYWLFVAPTFSAVGNTECGAHYWATVDCEPCVSLTDCNGDAIFSHPIDLPTDVWTFGGADALWVTPSTTLKRYDQYSLALGDVIGGITFWGVTTQQTTFNACNNEEPMTFEIAFWNDSAGVNPDFSGGPACRDTVVLDRMATGQIYHPTLQLPGYMWTYEYPIGQCCSLQTGWVSVTGISVGTPNCRYLWGSSGGSTGGNSRLYQNGVLQPTQTFDLAFCLLPCPEPCDPVIDLTVYLTLGNGNAKLDWNAPQAGNYDVYATTNPNAPEYPNAAWIYLGTQTVAAPGDASWTDPSAFANYKRYLVVHNCDE